MKRVPLTGMSGTGKSSVIEELAARGYRAVDTDYDGLSELITGPADEPTDLDPGPDWVWHEDRIQDLLSTDDADVLFLVCRVVRYDVRGADPAQPPIFLDDGARLAPARADSRPERGTGGLISQDTAPLHPAYGSGED